MGQIGGVNKTSRPGDAQKTSKSEGKQGASFSSTLQGATAAKAASSIDNPERAAKVASLKEQVANGTYEPDLNKVATSLLKFLVEEG